MKLKLPIVEAFGVNIVKNLLYFFLFFVLFILFLSLMIAPSIKDFKKYRSFASATQKEVSYQERNFQTLFKTYKKLQKDNKRSLEALNREFDKETFTKFASSFMKIKSIEDVNMSIYHDDFVKKEYMVYAEIKTPVNFYQLVEKSETYENILKIYFPIAMKSKKSEMITLKFRIEHFKVK